MSLLGLGSALSIAKETVAYGTASSGTYRRLPFLSESLTLDVAQVDNASLRGGTMLPTIIATRQGRRMVSGDVQSYLYDSGATLLLEAMLGQIATTGSGPYTHTATIPGPTVDLPSYTIQIGLGGTSSSFTRKRILGAVCESWEIAAASGEPVTLGMSWVGRDAELTATTAITGTEPSSQVHYDWRDATITTLGGLSLGCVRSFTISGNNNLNAERFCLGQTLMSVPERNGPPEITGTVEIEMPANGAKTIHDQQLAGTTVTLTATFDIGADAANTLVVNGIVQLLPSTYPVVSGPETLTYSIPFRVIRATNAATDAATFSLVAVNGDATA